MQSDGLYQGPLEYLYPLTQIGASLVTQLVQKSACNIGDPSSIPGLERSLGEGKDYPLQYSWACLVAQMVKSLPAVQETWV